MQIRFFSFISFQKRKLEVRPINVYPGDNYKEEKAKDIKHAIPFFT